jgi:DNA-binding transcriptional LysR family regulator
MDKTLSIAPLRSFVAIADCGGFQRAATALYLSQSAVSQHVRSLESAVGRPLVERHGRGSRLTTDGEQLLSQARGILALHDEVLHSFSEKTNQTLVIGSTEHAAAQLLPYLTMELKRTMPDFSVRVRIDRGARLREGLATGRIDLALLLGPAAESDTTQVGKLDLTWYSAPSWTLPLRGQPVPIVAFDDPCALRTLALQTLSRHDIPAIIGADATQLAGVQAAVAAGLGVALMATMGMTPEGLVPRDDLPTAEPLPLAIAWRQGLDAEIPRRADAALRRRLATSDSIIELAS